MAPARFRGATASSSYAALSVWLICYDRRAVVFIPIYTLLVAAGVATVLRMVHKGSTWTRKYIPAVVCVLVVILLFLLGSLLHALRLVRLASAHPIRLCSQRVRG
jgi:hypothetical protein